MRFQRSLENGINREQFAVADNHAKQVIEIMRYAARELPQCFQFLRLPKLFLQRSPRSYVFRNDLHQVALIIRCPNPPAAGAHNDSLPVLTSPVEFHRAEEIGPGGL